MAGLVPATHVFLCRTSEARRGCPAQGRAWQPRVRASTRPESAQALCQRILRKSGRTANDAF